MSEARIGSLPNVGQAIGTLPIANGGSGQVTANAALNAFLPSQGSASGQYLKSNGTNAAWSAVTAAPAYTMTSQASTLNPAVLGTHYILSGASFVVTLPTAVGVSGQEIILQHNGTSLTNKYTINTTSSQTLLGAGGTVASGVYILATNGEIAVLRSDGANWVVARHQTTILPQSYTPGFGTQFTITSGNATAGTTYTNNSVTFTVVVTIAASTTLVCTGGGVPTASGTLTKTGGGAGDATITFSTFGQANGAVSAPTYWWIRNGNFMKVWGSHTQGTAAATLWAMSLPAGAVIDTTYVSPSTNTISAAGAGVGAGMLIGRMEGNAGTSSEYNMVTACGSSTTTVFNASILSGTTTLVPQSTNSGLTNAAVASLSFEFPVSGWQP